jgi:hypothetical protein
MTKKINNRGGAREGSGRPVKKPTAPFYFRHDAEVIEKAHEKYPDGELFERARKWLNKIAGM